MAITTLAGAISGVQYPRDFVKAGVTAVSGRPFSYIYQGGMPNAAAAPSPGIGGAVLTSYAGQMPFTNPVSGNSYLARLQCQSTAPGTLWLCDRLWHNSGIDVTSIVEQAFTASAQIPARDRDGTTTGNGVYAAVEVSAAVGAGTPTLTLKYTNTAGTAGQLGVNQLATVASSAAGSFYTIGLATGDTGIQKAESLTLSQTWTSGTIHVVLFRVIAMLEVPLGSVISNSVDVITSGFPRMYDDSVPFLVWVSAAGASSQTVNGQMIVTQG
jgi:hypothetical protein